jgi:carbon-monoxide dehydrogenase small subunit
MQVVLNLNGHAVTHDVEDRTLLVSFLREQCGLSGTHVGCDTSQCGACAVLVDGEAVKSCTVLAAQAHGRAVQTIEGIAGAGPLHAVQEAFAHCHGAQCGYCTPGMIIATIELLRHDPEPTVAAIHEGLSGNLCRCTGYLNIVEAVQHAAQSLRP